MWALYGDLYQPRQILANIIKKYNALFLVFKYVEA